ncbi:Uncharacterized protein QTN25_002384 [Entamoeba marina]
MRSLLLPILFSLFVILSSAVPTDLLDKIHKYKDRAIVKNAAESKRVTAAEKKMDELYRRRIDAEVKAATRTAAQRKRVNDELMAEQIAAITKSSSQTLRDFERQANDTITARRRIASYKKMDMSRMSIDLKELQDMKRKELREAAKAQLIARKKSRRALRLLRINGMKKRMIQERETAKRRAIAEKMNADEIRKEVQERAKIVRIWRKKLAELKRSEHHKRRRIISIDKKITQEHNRKLKAKRDKITKKLKQKIREDLKRKRVEELRHRAFLRRCRAATDAYNKKERMVHKCVPIWKRDLPSFHNKLREVNKARVKIPGVHIEKGVDILAPIY